MTAKRGLEARLGLFEKWEHNEVRVLTRRDSPAAGHRMGQKQKHHDEADAERVDGEVCDPNRSQTDLRGL